MIDLKDFKFEKKEKSIEVKKYDQATVASFNFKVDFFANELNEQLQEHFKLLGDQITQMGGVIGHIKAVVEEKPISYRLSMTEDEVDVQKIQQQGASVNGAAIVFGIEPDDMQQLMEVALGQYINNQ